MGAIKIVQFRQAKRVLSGISVTWDYFTAPEGKRPGVIRDLSSTGLMLCSSVEMEDRRWLRIVIPHPQKNISRVIRGRIVRQEPALDCWPDEQITLFRQAIELIDHLPEDWVKALGNPGLSTCSCGSILESKKPANLAGSADEICGLCHLKSALLISRP